MGLSRRRDSSIIWPGFVDAVTTLLMVLMFVLTIFTVMQSVLQETISTQGSELDSLTRQVADLADTLGMERSRVTTLQSEISGLRAGLATAEATGTRQATLIDSLTGQLGEATTALGQAQTRVAGFETQVASLAAERDAARVRAEGLVAQIADLRATAAAERDAAMARLTEAEAARLADAAAALALQERLAGTSEALTAMTLALEAQRQRAEETLTLLAAADTRAARAARDTEQRAAVLAAAEQALTEEQQKSVETARRVALLNAQIAELRTQLGALQAVLDTADDRDAAAKLQLETLGAQLNTALAQVAAEQRRRATLEEAERLRLEAENLNLEKFRSEFFGQLRQVLAGRDGVRVVGDRFVFSSEVLFQPGSADLRPEGRSQIAGVVAILDDVRAQIPDGLDWIIRVDGHTDDVPLSGFGIFADNWQLSQERALSVVRFMQDDLGFPPDRMAAAGFGQYRPVATGDSEAARAQNRRIELKLTER